MKHRIRPCRLLDTRVFKFETRDSKFSNPPDSHRQTRSCSSTRTWLDTQTVRRGRKVLPRRSDVCELWDDNCCRSGAHMPCERRSVQWTAYRIWWRHPRGHWL